MKKIILSLAILFFVAGVNAQIEKPVTWTYTAKKISGDMYELHMTATIQPKWHLYAQDAGEGPIPTTILFDKNPIIKLEGRASEVGKMIKEFDKNFNSTLKFYATKVDFVQKIKLKVAAATVAKGKINYMTCNDSKCLPNNSTFAIKINPKG
jgi:DsbC/DsbD-like thiol-disulfide interchange protein